MGSAKWRRWQSLAKKSPYRATASRTTVGNSTIPGMIRYSALQQRPRKFGSEYADFTYFDAVETLFAKLQMNFSVSGCFASNFSRSFTNCSPVMFSFVRRRST